ncbi:MAG: NAD(P)H-hydrate dehydratase, partial [Polyangia bacterium]
DSFDRLSAICASPTVKAVVLGPGIPRGPRMRRTVHRLVRELVLPLVVDADGLNLLGDQAAALLASARGPRVVTPHPGEMARLTGLSTAQVQADRLGTARRFAAASRAVVVLKGARTLVVAPDGTAFVNPAVEPALATAGSGDVLTGVVGALLSQGMEPVEAARAAVFLHGRAGARAAATYGPTGVVAGDLPEAVAEVRASWSAAAVDSR